MRTLYWSQPHFNGRGSRTAHAFAGASVALCGYRTTRRLMAAGDSARRCGTCTRIANNTAKESSMPTTAKQFNIVTANKESAMPAMPAKSTATKSTKATRKATGPVETNEQRIARLERAATGSKHVAEVALKHLADGVRKDVTASRIAGLAHGAEVAMRNANDAAKAAKATTLPYPGRIATHINRVVKEATPAAKAAPVVNPKSKAAKPRSTKRPAVKVEPVAAAYRIETLNRADGSVDGHIAGCADIAKVAKRERLDRSGEWTVANKKAAWLEYNADFIAEHDHDDSCNVVAGVQASCSNAYDINWLPCADQVPAFNDSKPVQKRSAATKSAPKATKSAAPQADSAIPSKAQALRDYGKDQGWAMRLDTPNKSTVVVVAERDGETLAVTFIDNKITAQAMPKYTRTDGSVVTLRNVSAVRKQMDSDAAARPVKAQRSVLVRKRSTSDEGDVVDASRRLPVDSVTADLDTLKKALEGRDIKWRLSAINGGMLMTARVWAVKRYYACKGTMCVEFIEAMPTKRGLTPGAIRTVALDKITYAA